MVTVHGFSPLIQYSVDNQTNTQTILRIILKTTAFSLKCVNLCDISNLPLVAL